MISSLMVQIILNFNPRLREGGDGETNAEERTENISIHASAREATTFKLRC
mgnify:CR=1 FL=1